MVLVVNRHVLPSGFDEGLMRHGYASFAGCASMESQRLLAKSVVTRQPMGTIILNSYLAGL